MIFLFFLIVFGVLAFVFLIVLIYFFCVAFVRQNLGDFNDVNSPVNKPLEKFKDIISGGIEYIKNTPCKEVNVVSYDGLTLFARYFDNKSDKTVILLHGYRSSAMRDFSCAVKMYTDFGFNVLLCDQRAQGLSEGNLITFGIKESYDVISWVEFITEKFATKKILLGGLSMGATTVLLSCSHNLPDSVKGMVADCGFTSPVAIINKVAKQHFKINANLVLPFLNIFCLLFGKFSIYGHNTKDAIKDSKIPILFIHGKNDGFVPCSMTEEAFACANSDSKLLIVDGADHGLSFLVDRETVLSEIKAFLKNSQLLQ